MFVTTSSSPKCGAIAFRQSYLFIELPQGLFVQHDRRGPSRGAGEHLAVANGRSNILEAADLLVDDVHRLQHRLGESADGGMPGVFLADPPAVADQHHNGDAWVDADR